MAKTLYVPVNNLSSEVKKILVPVGGLSKYAVKGYCSVNGLSKQFFGSSGMGWPYKESDAVTIITFHRINPSPYATDKTVTKKYQGLAYYGLLKWKNNASDQEYKISPILMAKNPNRSAVEQVEGETTISTITVDNELWYWCFGWLDYTESSISYYEVEPDCYMTDEVISQRSAVPNFLIDFISQKIIPYEN